MKVKVILLVVCCGYEFVEFVEFVVFFSLKYKQTTITIFFFSFLSENSEKKYRIIYIYIYCI